MTFFTSCCNGFARLSRAAAKAASAKLRAAGIGSAIDAETRRVRLSVCQACPMARIHKGRVYCGPPLLQRIVRDPAIDGCGCPILPKSADPSEHCPINARFLASGDRSGGCDCKWCAGDEPRRGVSRN